MEPLDVIMVDERSTGPMIDRDGHLFFGSLSGHENNSQQEDSLTKWFRTEADPDGYFLLQLAEKIADSNMFLTSNDAFSLTIASKLCLLLFSRLIMRVI